MLRNKKHEQRNPKLVDSASNAGVIACAHCCHARVINFTAGAISLRLLSPGELRLLSPGEVALHGTPPGEALPEQLLQGDVRLALQATSPRDRGGPHNGGRSTEGIAAERVEAWRNRSVVK